MKSVSNVSKLSSMMRQRLPTRLTLRQEMKHCAMLTPTPTRATVYVSQYATRMYVSLSPIHGFKGELVSIVERSRFERGPATDMREAVFASKAVARRDMAGGDMKESRGTPSCGRNAVTEASVVDRRLDWSETLLWRRDPCEMCPCPPMLMPMTLPGGEKGLSRCERGVPGAEWAGVSKGSRETSSTPCTFLSRKNIGRGGWSGGSRDEPTVGGAKATCSDDEVVEDAVVGLDIGKIVEGKFVRKDWRERRTCVIANQLWFPSTRGEPPSGPHRDRRMAAETGRQAGTRSVGRLLSTFWNLTVDDDKALSGVEISWTYNIWLVIDPAESAHLRVRRISLCQPPYSVRGGTVPVSAPAFTFSRDTPGRCRAIGRNLMGPPTSSRVVCARLCPLDLEDAVNLELD